jgi:hypothetical protein
VLDYCDTLKENCRDKQQTMFDLQQEKRHLCKEVTWCRSQAQLLLTSGNNVFDYCDTLKQNCRDMQEKTEELSKKFRKEQSKWSHMELGYLNRISSMQGQLEHQNLTMNQQTATAVNQADGHVSMDQTDDKPTSPALPTTDVKQDQTKKSGKYACSRCHKVFRTRDGMQGHWNRHIGKKITCKKCKKTFYSPSAYAHHMDFHKEGGVTCKVCGKIFEQGSGLLNHTKTHAPASFKCTASDTCCKTFKFHCDQLEHDKYYHLTEKMVICPFCEQRFQAPNNLKSHIYNKHRDGF